MTRLWIWRLACGLASFVVGFACMTAQADLRVDLSQWDGEQAPVGACMVAWDECTTLAAGGDARAQYLVGYIYTMGLRPDGGDPDKARRWLERAAQQRLPLAMVLLGRLYWEGGSTTRDAVKAAVWFDLAEKLAPDEHIRISARDEFRDIEWHLDGRQMAAVKRLSRDWLDDHPPAVAIPPLPPMRPADR